MLAGSHKSSMRQMSEQFDADVINPVQEGKSAKSQASADGKSTRVLLPVEKGIFRRKHDKVAPEDLEAGGGGAGGGVDGQEAGEDVPLLANGNGRSANTAGGNGGPAATAAAGGGLLGGLYQWMGWSKSANNNGKQHSAVLQKNESFDGHRSALISKWKRNARSTGDDEEQQLVEVRERGYNFQGEENLHKYQRGKLSGVEAVNSKEGRQWAAAGLEGTIVRK